MCRLAGANTHTRKYEKGGIKRGGSPEMPEVLCMGGLVGWAQPRSFGRQGMQHRYQQAAGSKGCLCAGF